MAAILEQPKVEVESEPAGPAGDLQAEVDEFTDLPGCVKRHRLTDPLLADGIEAIGYERLVTDACRSIEAMKTRDPKRCEAALSSAVRRHCEADFAMFVGDESRCPVSARFRDAPEHDVTCVAAARRDVRPCASLAGGDRASCEGLVAHDPSRCGTDGKCLRLLERWKSALPRTLGKTPYAALASIDIRTADDTADGGATTETAALAKEAAAGAILIISGKTTRLSFGDTRSFTQHIDATEAGFLVDLPNTSPGDTKLTHGLVRATVRYPSMLVQELTPATISRIRIIELATEPNGPVKVELETMVGHSGQSRAITFHIDTWLRDRVVVEKN